LSKAGLPVVWTTPIGFRVTQAYRPLKDKRLVTVVGRVQVQDPDPVKGFDTRKQATSAAPNIIHSLDAAMLQVCARELFDRGVYGSWIHDSYGALPNHIPLLHDILRETAFAIFKEDVLADLNQQFAELAESAETPVKLPAPPTLGSFDVEQVLRAPYFFS